MTRTIGSYDGTVRAVQQALGELPPEAFSSPVRVAEGILAVVDAETPPLRLALGTSGARDMQAALESRLGDLDRWANVTAAVDR
jgi:hypothetical protein